MGRRAKTSRELKAQLATFGEDLNEHHQGEVFEDILPPKLGPAGTLYWNQNARKLFDMRKMRVESAPLLVSLCKALDDEAELAAIVERQGRVIVNTSGNVVLHPAVRALVSIRSTIKANANALGIGPLSEGRVVAPPAATEEETEEEMTLRKFNIA